MHVEAEEVEALAAVGRHQRLAGHVRGDGELEEGAEVDGLDERDERRALGVGGWLGGKEGGHIGTSMSIRTQPRTRTHTQRMDEERHHATLSTIYICTHTYIHIQIYIYMHTYLVRPVVGVVRRAAPALPALHLVHHGARGGLVVGHVHRRGAEREGDLCGCLCLCGLLQGRNGWMGVCVSSEVSRVVE